MRTLYHGKRVYKDFEMEKLGKYHDLYLKSDALFLANVFKNFSKICLSFRSYKIRGKISIIN